MNDYPFMGGGLNNKKQYCYTHSLQPLFMKYNNKNYLKEIYCIETKAFKHQYRISMICTKKSVQPILK